MRATVVIDSLMALNGRAAQVVDAHDWTARR